MDLYAIIGLGVIAAILVIVLRQQRPEFAMLASLAAGLVILLAVIANMVPVVEQIGDIFAATSMPDPYVQILFKSLGICLLTQIACDTCKDAGEGAIGAKIELAGKIAVLVVSLPLFSQVLSIVQTLLA